MSQQSASSIRKAGWTDGALLYADREQAQHLAKLRAANDRFVAALCRADPEGRWRFDRGARGC